MSKHPASASIALVFFTALALNACSPRETAPPPTQKAPTPTQAEPASAGTIRIGELSGMALRDGSVEFPNDNKILGVGKTKEEVAGVLTAAGLPADKLTLTISPLLVRAADRTLLFDAGAGASFGPSAGGLTQSLNDAGIGVDSITDIFISHAHGDHVGGLVNAAGALSYPNATIHLSSAEWAFLKAMTPETGASAGHAQLLAAITPKVTPFEPGADLIPGVVKAVDIRGHTPGHSGYLIGSGASSLLYIGDTMHHYVISVQQPEWTISFDQDAATAQKSRSDLLSQSAASGQRIYAVHFPYPAVGKFAARGEGFVWVPE